MKLLSRPFFTRPAIDVAPDLLGKVLMVHGVGGIITETEAYSHDDEASHCFRGKTQRNAAMFETGGTVYVYRSYGIHYCVNIVADKKDVGAGILIRSIKPLDEHLQQVIQRRGSHIDLKNLCNGPGKVCQALGINLADNFTDTCRSEEFAVLDAGLRPVEVMKTPRIGISKNKDKLWRFLAREFVE